MSRFPIYKCQAFTHFNWWEDYICTHCFWGTLLFMVAHAINHPEIRSTDFFSVDTMFSNVFLLTIWPKRTTRSQLLCSTVATATLKMSRLKCISCWCTYVKLVMLCWRSVSFVISIPILYIILLNAIRVLMLLSECFSFFQEISTPHTHTLIVHKTFPDEAWVYVFQLRWSVWQNSMDFPCTLGVTMMDPFFFYTCQWNDL